MRVCPQALSDRRYSCRHHVIRDVVELVNDYATLVNPRRTSVTFAIFISCKLVRLAMRVHTAANWSVRRPYHTFFF
jgi:hypothetical protein